MLRNSLLGSVAALTLTSVAVAQQPVPAPANAPAEVVQTYRASQILGSKILIENNSGIGKVEDLIFDTAGNLEYLVVNHDGKLISVPWDAAKWDVKNQSGTVSITPEVLKTIPTFTPTTYPDFWAPTYRVQTYKYYNLTPRELRRIERRLR